MDDLVEISIPVEAEAAKALGDARKREAIGPVISRMLKPSKDENPLLLLWNGSVRTRNAVD